MKYCTKISADIDNYFAEKNTSNEELARFIYYAQNLEFESMMAAPTRYAIFYKVHKKGLRILKKGVTKRFIEASNFGKRKAAVKKVVAKPSVAKDNLKTTKTTPKKNTTKSTDNTKKEAKNTKKQPQNTTKVKK